MARYLGAAMVLVDAVHHSGHDPTRPRGHTSLTAAADAQVAIKRDGAIFAKVEWMKGGPLTATLSPAALSTSKSA